MREQTLSEKDISVKETQKRTDNIQLKVVNLKAWIILLPFLIIAVIIIRWLLFGAIGGNISRPAIITTDYPLEKITHMYEGWVDEVFVSEGDSIQRGDIIATIVADKSWYIYDESTNTFHAPEKITHIISPISGTIEQLDISKGTYIEPSAPVAAIMEDGYSPVLEYAYSTIPVDTDAKIVQGSPVFVYVDGVDKDYFGHLTGEVVFIDQGSTPLSELMQRSGNNSTYEYITEANVDENVLLHEVLIKLETDEDGKLLFSSGKNPPVVFTYGKTSTAVFPIDNGHPIQDMFGSR